MIDRMSQDPHHIASLAAQVEACLAEKEPPMARLGNARWVLARALFAHITAEDGDGLRDGSPDPAPLRQQLHDHIAQWGTPQILADWHGYRVAEARLLAALRRRDRTGRVPVRPGASPVVSPRAPARDAGSPRR